LHIYNRAAAGVRLKSYGSFNSGTSHGHNLWS